MASKKPAKPMAGQSKQTTQDPTVYGSLIKIYGFKGAGCICNNCGKNTIHGMVRQKNDNFYCSAVCAIAS
jgi:hypothetical protein